MIPLLLFTQQILAQQTPKEPLKPWTPDMCEVQQAYATDEYLQYCRIRSPNKHPHCSATALRQKHEKDAKFEYWDCSWHPGHTPRK